MLLQMVPETQTDAGSGLLVICLLQHTLETRRAPQTTCLLLCIFLLNFFFLHSFLFFEGFSSCVSSSPCSPQQEHTRCVPPPQSSQQFVTSPSLSTYQHSGNCLLHPLLHGHTTP